MGTTHGHVYANGNWVGWASYVEEPFGHTLKARVCFAQSEVSRRWDTFEMQVSIQAGGKQYLRCSNIRKTGGITVGGQVWTEYLISYGEQVLALDSPPASESSQHSPQ